MSVCPMCPWVFGARLSLWCWVHDSRFAVRPFSYMCRAQTLLWASHQMYLSHRCRTCPHRVHTSCTFWMADFRKNGSQGHLASSSQAPGSRRWTSGIRRQADINTQVRPLAYGQELARLLRDVHACEQARGNLTKAPGVLTSSWDLVPSAP